jgi:hypothetical protein
MWLLIKLPGTIRERKKFYEQAKHGVLPRRREQVTAEKHAKGIRIKRLLATLSDQH